MISGLAFFLVLKDAWSCLWNNEGASLDANTMSDGQLLLFHAKLGGGFIGCGVSGIASGLLFAFASILALTEKTNSSSPH